MKPCGQLSLFDLLQSSACPISAEILAGAGGGGSHLPPARCTALFLSSYRILCSIPFPLEHPFLFDKHTSGFYTITPS